MLPGNCATVSGLEFQGTDLKFQICAQSKNNVPMIMMTMAAVKRMHAVRCVVHNDEAILRTFAA